MINGKDQLVIGTSNLELKLYHLDEEIWIEQTSTSMNDIIVSMQEDDQGNMWMAGTRSIYKTSSSDSTFIINEIFDLNNIFLDDVNILNRNDTLYFINSEGYFYFDTTARRVVENAALKEKIGNPIHHLFDPVENGVWVYNGKLWTHLKPDGSLESIEYLGLFL